MLAVVGILPSVFRFEEPLVMSIDKETRQISPPRGSSLIALQGSYPCQSPQDWISLSLSLSLWLNSLGWTRSVYVPALMSRLQVSSHHHQLCLRGLGVVGPMG